MVITAGSFHVKSSDFWPFFHGPPQILLKFGTLDSRTCLENNIRQIFFYLGQARSEIWPCEKMEK